MQTWATADVHWGRSWCPRAFIDFPFSHRILLIFTTSAFGMQICLAIENKLHRHKDLKWWELKFQWCKQDHFEWKFMNNIDPMMRSIVPICRFEWISHFVLVPIITHVRISMVHYEREECNWVIKIYHHPELEIVFLILLMVKNYTSTIQTVFGS